MLISAPLSMSACICLAFPCISRCQHGHHNGACQPLSNLQVAISSPIMLQNSPKDTQPTTHPPCQPLQPCHVIRLIELESIIAFPKATGHKVNWKDRFPSRWRQLVGYSNSQEIQHFGVASGTGLEQHTPRCYKMPWSQCVESGDARMLTNTRKMFCTIVLRTTCNVSFGGFAIAFTLVEHGDVVVESKSSRHFLLITSRRKFLQRSRCGQLKKHIPQLKSTKIVLDQAVAPESGNCETNIIIPLAPPLLPKAVTSVIKYLDR